jgi:hypothetical protein
VGTLEPNESGTGPEENCKWRTSLEFDSGGEERDVLASVEQTALAYFVFGEERACGLGDPHALSSVNGLAVVYCCRFELILPLVKPHNSRLTYSFRICFVVVFCKDILVPFRFSPCT